MKKFKILTTPTRLQDLDAEDWYGDWGEDAQLKAERLRARRDRKFKQEG